MAIVRKIRKNIGGTEKTIYPVTVTTAVFDPNTGLSIKDDMTSVKNSTAASARNAEASANEASEIAAQVNTKVAQLQAAIASLPDGSSVSAQVAKNLVNFGVDTFVTTRAYAYGEFVLYNGSIYKFTADKAKGAWSSTKVVLAGLADLMSLDYAKQDGRYPQLVSGLSEGFVASGNSQEMLVGSTPTPKNIISGSARITKVKGKSIVWQELVRNPLFESADEWTFRTDTTSGLTISNGIATITSTANFAAINSTQFSTVPAGHVCMLIIRAKSSSNTDVQMPGRYQNGSSYAFAYSPRISISTVYGTRYKKFAFNSTYTVSCNSLEMPTCGSGVTLNIDYIILIDLTACGLESCTTPDEVAQALGYDSWQVFSDSPEFSKWMTYTAQPQLVSTSARGMRSTGTLEDGTTYQYDRLWEDNVANLFDGELKSAGTVYDEITEKKSVKRIGVVDMGTLTYTYRENPNSTGYNQFYSSGFPKTAKIPNYLVAANACMAGYTVKSADYAWKNGGLYFCIAASGNIEVYSNAYSSASAFKTAMNGVMCYFELATPITTDIDQPLTLTHVSVKEDATTGKEGSGRLSAIYPVSGALTSPINAEIAFARDYRKQVEDNMDDIANIVGGKQHIAIEYQHNPQMSVGFATNLTPKGIATEQTYTEQTIGGSSSASVNDGAMSIESIKGNTVAWGNAFASTYKVERTSSTNAQYVKMPDSVSFVKDHKYIFGTTFNASNSQLQVITNESSVVSEGYLRTATPILVFTSHGNAKGSAGVSAQGGAWFYIAANTPTFVASKFFLIDLTLAFGSTVASTISTANDVAKLLGYSSWDAFVASDAFDSWMEYTETPRLVSMTASGIKVGASRNLWDEEWEYGTLSTTDGSVTTGNDYIRSINYTKVTPSSTLYCKGAVRVFFYDANKSFVSIVNPSNSTFAVPSNAYYFKLRKDQGANYVAYNNDICINVSDSSFNGKYEPYRTNSVEWGSLFETSELKEAFPYGLLSAGTVRDEITSKGVWKRVGMYVLQADKLINFGKSQGNSVYRAYTASNPINDIKLPTSMSSDIVGVADIGYLVNSFDSYWCTDKSIALRGEITVADNSLTSLAQFKALCPITIYYPLSTPVFYPFERELAMSAQCAKNGTESIIVPEGKMSTAVKTTEVYSFNAYDTIVNLLARVTALENK